MHFVKHSLALALLAILTGCGGNSDNSAPSSSGSGSNTPDPAVTTVASVSPTTATVGTLTTFTISGQRLSSSLQVSLANCQNISGLSGPTTGARFTCTPQTAGTERVTVRTADGTTLFSGDITFKAPDPAEQITITNIEIPSALRIGQIATFTINGENLPDTLQISLPQCTNITQTSITPTKVVFTCTPQAAGTYTLRVRSAAGVDLNNGGQPTVVPAALTSTWRQTTANGCTGSVTGEAIAEGRSVTPLFTFVTDSKQRVRFMGNDALSYLSDDCSVSTSTTDVIQAAPTTGVTRFAAVYDNVSEPQLAEGVVYYTVDTTFSNDNPAVPSATAIVFKDANTFCLFNGTVSPSAVKQFIDGVDINQRGCFARGLNLAFSQEQPENFLSSAEAQLIPRVDGELLVNVIDRLNQRGQTGHVLLREAQSLRSALIGDTRKTYDLVSQLSGFSGLTFNYRQESAATSDDARLIKLNELGQQGWLFIGDKRLDAFFGTRPTYARTNFNKERGHRFTYQQRTDSDVIDNTKFVSILNAQGTQGCRFIESVAQVPASTRKTLCVNNSRINSAFNYRSLAYPTSPRTDAFKALLDTQRADGYYPIRILDLGDDIPPQILFESNRDAIQDIRSFQYKIFSQPLPDNQPELDSFLNDQGRLGWQLWGEVPNATGQHLATVFARSPFPHLADGEPAVFDR